MLLLYENIEKLYCVEIFNWLKCILGYFKGLYIILDWILIYRDFYVFDNGVKLSVIIEVVLFVVVIVLILV